MEDREIYDLASDLIETLNRELGEGIYRELKGELSIRWDSNPKFGAYASSYGPIDEPPQHCVTIHYAFVRQLWRDAEDFCQFLDKIPAGSPVDQLYDFYDDRTKLPSYFPRKDQIKNLFIAALTWVYFHEIGHLMQEHGHIRAQHGLGQKHKSSEIHEFAASAAEPLTGSAAVISHVTELAADFEATNLCMLELFRHIRDPDFVDEEDRDELLSGLVYLMICGLSIVFYRFNGSLPPTPSSIPQGSHPDPLVRLELNVPHICEILRIFNAAGAISNYFDRRQLALLSGKALLSTSLYWSMTKTTRGEVDSSFMIRGLLSRVEVLYYLEPIIKCWDEILPEIKAIRRVDNPLGLLTFTDEFKDRVNKKIPWGEGPEKFRK